MNSDARYLSSSHAKYLTQYRLIWCPEYRFPVLEDGTDILLKEILYWIAGNYGFVTKALEVIPDHIHIFLDAPHTMAPCQIANIF